MGIFFEIFCIVCLAICIISTVFAGFTFLNIGGLCFFLAAGLVCIYLRWVFLQGKNKVKKTKTFKELLDACGQDYVSHDFKEKYFPLEPVAPDEDKWEVYEHGFSKKISGQDAFRSLRALGYRLLDGSCRAMEYIAVNPNFQTNDSLIMIVCWQYPNRHWYAPIFWLSSGVCYLEMINLGRKFSPSFKWLVLRKKTP